MKIDDIKKLAADNKVSFDIARAIAETLEAYECPEEELPGAFAEVANLTKQGKNAVEEAEAWMERKLSDQAIDANSNAIDNKMSLTQQEDADDVLYAAERRGTAMRADFHYKTAQVFLHGPTDPELQKTDANVRQSFRIALREAAKKNYQIGLKPMPSANSAEKLGLKFGD